MRLVSKDLLETENPGRIRLWHEIIWDLNQDLAEAIWPSIRQNVRQNGCFVGVFGGYADIVSWMPVVLGKIETEIIVVKHLAKKDTIRTPVIF